MELINAEGAGFAQGYVKPLYLQPIYQKKTAFKNGYPFSAKENVGLNQNYALGCCSVAEELHFKKLLTTEFVRPPHTSEDIRDLINIFRKVALLCR